MHAATLAHRVELLVGERTNGVERHGPGHVVHVVHRHPGVPVERIPLVGRDQRVPRHQPLGDAPVVVARIGVAARADQQPGGRLENVEHRVGVARVLGAVGVAVERIAVEIVAMQEGDVARVDAAFHRLQIVRFLPALRDVDMAARQMHPFEVRRRRLLGRRAHIGPDHPAQLDGRIGLELDLLREAARRRLGRHVDALPGHVVFPAVIAAAQAALLVAAEPQRHAAMGAELVHQPDTPLRVAERDQPLAQELDARRRTVRPRQLFGQQRGDPVATEELAHRCAGAGPAQIFVLLVGDHVVLPS